MFFSIPNEGLGHGGDRKKSAIRMNKLKRMGLLPGAADLVVLQYGRAYFLEVKTSTGRLSKNQKLFATASIAHGALYAVVRSIDETAATLKRWGIISP